MYVHVQFMTYYLQLYFIIAGYENLNNQKLTFKFCYTLGTHLKCFILLILVFIANLCRENVKQEIDDI